MKKMNRDPQAPAPSAGKAPSGRRSGKGASSVLPYLEEARTSRPAPLEPTAAPVPAKRWHKLW